MRHWKDFTFYTLSLFVLMALVHSYYLYFYSVCNFNKHTYLLTYLLTYSLSVRVIRQIGALSLSNNT